MSCLEEQEDELTALESILGRDCQIQKQSAALPDKGESLKAVRIFVHVKLPSPQITLNVWISLAEPNFNQKDGDSLDGAVAQSVASANPSPNQSSYQRSDSGHRVIATVSVNHLPPICIECTLPTSYPTSTPPLFTMSSSWLGITQLSSLCRHLDNIWALSPGAPVIFSWIDWLENNAAEHLGISDSIVIASQSLMEEMGSVRDPRAICECRNFEATLMSLLQFDFEQEQAVFQQNWHSCSLCLDEKAGSEFFRIRGCQHSVCQVCMQDYCRHFVGEGSVQRLSCPYEKCDQRLPLDMIKSVLGEEEFRRWERLVFQKSLDVMADVEYCPRCQLPVVRDDLNSGHAQCAYCLFSFCVECHESWHQGKCAEIEVPEEEEEEEEEEADGKESKFAKQKKLKEEHLSMQAVKASTTRCPGCKSPVYKFSGCNKMACSVCYVGFCFLCGKPCSYDHFQETRCHLFEIDGDDAYQERQVLRRVPDRMRAEGAVRVERLLEEDPEALLRVCRCPTCHQRNLKEHQNNHIKCWQCKTNFCYTCKKKIIGSATSHFSKVSGGCPQHSND